jgi:hypothetical protein
VARKKEEAIGVLNVDLKRFLEKPFVNTFTLITCHNQFTAMKMQHVPVIEMRHKTRDIGSEAYAMKQAQE